MINSTRTTLASAFVLCMHGASLGQWAASAFVPSGGLYEVEFPRPDAAYIIGDFGYLYKSTDAGISWNVQYEFGPFASLSDLQFINADTGFVRSVQAYNYRTTDGGASWIQFGPGMKLDIVGQTLFASTAENDTTRILRSDDLGDSWTTHFAHPHPGGEPYLFSIIDAMNAYFIEPDELDRLYKTSDGFATIDTIVSFMGDIVLQEEFHFTDTTYGYLYGSWGSLSQPSWTWWGGILHFPIDLDGFGVLPVLDMTFNTTDLYASSLYGKIFRSTNQGTSWTAQATPTLGPLHSISFANDQLGIAVSNVQVLYTSNGGFTGVQQLEGSGPGISVHPNPATGLARIDADPALALRSLVLTDMHGKEVLQLSTTARTIDTTILVAGTYFLRAGTDGGMVTTKVVVAHDR
ncbi:MAG: T9SS type A sorting domain-containing protein [Flavobacteriales bacterium]|nr:T9SS type A sorting domain-containing protein [Flavobacteriales bacterium]